MIRYIFIFVLLGALFAHSRSNYFFGINQAEIIEGVHLETIMLDDTARGRIVPIAIYKNFEDTILSHKPIVIFNHGYGKNSGESYLKYSFLNEHLASKGYYVISIQHEVKTDDKLPMSGNIKELRLPFWDRGIENIQFTIDAVSKMFPDLDFSKITLIGHSNGGDIAAHFTALHPDSVKNLITLDNLRKEIPLVKEVNILTLRANDTEADHGVIPSKNAVANFHFRSKYMENVAHSDMTDRGTSDQKAEIILEIDKFLLK